MAKSKVVIFHSYVPFTDSRLGAAKDSAISADTGDIMVILIWRFPRMAMPYNGW